MPRPTPPVHSTSSALTHDHHLVDVHVANLRGKLRRHSDAR